MRLLVDLIIAAAIIALGWEKSLRDRARDVPWLAQLIASDTPTKTKAVLTPGPTVSPSGAWMWDPNHRSALDTPKPKSTITPSSTAGSWMWDPNHKTVLDPANPHPVHSP
jgi:hypothetical protein